MGDAWPATALLRSAALTTESLVARCEEISTAYRRLWASELCDEFGIAIGLLRLLPILRGQLRPKLPHGAIHRGRVLVVPMPKETHIVGAALATESLSDQGYLVTSAYPTAEEDLLELLTDHEYDAVVLATSGVFTRQERLPAFASLVGAVRSVCGSRLRIVLYGRLAAVCPRVITDVDLDQVTERAAAISIAPYRRRISALLKN